MTSRAFTAGTRWSRGPNPGPPDSSPDCLHSTEGLRAAGEAVPVCVCGGLLLDFRPQRSRAPIHQARPPGDPASHPDPASPGRMLAPYAGVLYSAPWSGPDPHPWDPARLLRLRQPPPPAADAPPGRPSPLFFCVRAISFSISEIFSRIPMAVAEPGAQATQTAAAPRTPARRRLQISGAGSPPRTASACARSTGIQTPGGRRRAQCQMLLVPPARPAGLERGGGWAGPGRGQAGGGEAR